MDTLSATNSPATDSAAQRARKAAAQLTAAPPDRHIWGIYIMLCIISVIELYSASSREVSLSHGLGIYAPIVRHGIFLGAGLMIILIVQRIHYSQFLRWIPLFALGSVLMMVYVLGFGEEVNGARRSFSLMGFSLQPSEFLKFSSAAMIALIMSLNQQKKGGVKLPGVYWTLGIVGLFALLLVPQGLTNTLLLIAISGSMMIVSGVSWRIIGMLIGALLLLGALVLGVHFLCKEAFDITLLPRVDVWWSRLTNFTDSTPLYAQPLDSENAQEMYSYMAQAHGGVFGVLPGNSREASRLPLAFSDYIYSIIVEDMGLIGGLFVITLYLWLLGRASTIASRCTRAFPAFLVIGMALVIVFQALFHVCIVVGVFPVSGQPLPLISKGGSSILITSLALGVMLSVSRYAVREGSSSREIKLELDTLPEDVRAENPTKL